MAVEEAHVGGGGGGLFGKEGRPPTRSCAPSRVEETEAGVHRNVHPRPAARRIQCQCFTVLTY
jgi:hypothetical protein